MWRTLRNPQDSIAHVAFRVLGKFGGGNRKMLCEPQTVNIYETMDIRRLNIEVQTGLPLIVNKFRDTVITLIFRPLLNFDHSHFVKIIIIFLTP